MKKQILFILFALFALLFSQVAFAGELQILQVSNSSTIPGTIYAGDLITLTFDVENISGVGSIANNIKVSIELNENDFEPVKNSETISEIKSRGSKTVSLRFKAKDTVLPGNYTVPVFLEYTSVSDKVIQSEEINFDVSACQILRIEDISLSNSQPHIGDSLEISASIKNICSTATRNVNVELKSVTNTTIDPFIVSSGTLQEIGDILPGKSKDVKFSMDISDKVTAQTYVFSIDVSCSECTETFSNSFSFLVLGEPELVFSNIEYSVDAVLGGSDKIIMQGNSFTFSVQLDNIGDEKAKAVDVVVEFDEITGVKKAFLGNIDPDDSGAAIFNLTVPYTAKSGEHPGEIIISYIDELGDEKQVVESYSIHVTEQPPVSPIVYIFILILIIVVLALIYFVTKFIFRQLALRKAQSR